MGADERLLAKKQYETPPSEAALVEGQGRLAGPALVTCVMTIPCHGKTREAPFEVAPDQGARSRSNSGRKSATQRAEGRQNRRTDAVPVGHSAVSRVRPTFSRWRRSRTS